MKRLLVSLTFLVLTVLPHLALAQPPGGGGPGSGGGGGAGSVGSPEPMAIVLLLAGAIPAYLLYRWTERRAIRT